MARYEDLKVNKLRATALFLGTGLGTDTEISSTELEMLDGLTAGTVTASKLVTVDANKDVGDFRNLDCVNLDAGASGTAGSVDVFPSTASRGKFTLACTDQTGNTAVTVNANAMGQATTVNIADPGAAASYVVQSTAALTLAEVDVLDAVTAGTVAASKAVVVDANKDAGDFRNLDCVNLDAGASGTAGSVDVFPATAARGKLSLACTDQTGDTAVTINANAMGQATTVNVADPGAAASYVVQSTAALTLAEADVLDAVTAGTVSASKALVVDANKDLATLRDVTARALSLTGAVTTGITVGGASTTGIAVTGAATTAAIQLGVDGTTAGDFIAYGATTGCHLQYDTSADELLLVKTSATATAVNIATLDVSQTLTGASAVNTAEAFRSVLTSNVQVGNWANAVLGKIDFSTAGFVTGLAGAVCAELDMPAATIGNGSYCCFEAELNAPTGAAGWGVSVPVSFLTGNAWGAGVAEFRDDGYIFNFTGLGTATATKVFDECTAAAASHALRILIDGVPYYIMLNSNVDA